LVTHRCASGNTFKWQLFLHIWGYHIFVFWKKQIFSWGEINLLNWISFFNKSNTNWRQKKKLLFLTQHKELVCKKLFGELNTFAEHDLENSEMGFPKNNFIVIRRYQISPSSNERVRNREIVVNDTEYSVQHRLID